MAAVAAAMAAEEAEEALGLFTGIGLSEAKARETLRNGALTALLRRAVLQVRPPRARTPVPGPRSPVPRHPDVTSGPGHAGNSLPWYRCHPSGPGASIPGVTRVHLRRGPAVTPSAPAFPGPPGFASCLGPWHSPVRSGPRCCRFLGARAPVLP